MCQLFGFLLKNSGQYGEMVQFRGAESITGCKRNNQKALMAGLIIHLSINK